MAVKDFRDLVGDIISDFAKNSSIDVYVFTQTADDKYHLHDGKCKSLQKNLSNARIVPLKLAEYMGYKTLCGDCAWQMRGKKVPSAPLSGVL